FSRDWSSDVCSSDLSLKYYQKKIKLKLLLVHSSGSTFLVIWILMVKATHIKENQLQERSYSILVRSSGLRKYRKLQRSLQRHLDYHLHSNLVKIPKSLVSNYST